MKKTLIPSLMVLSAFTALASCGSHLPSVTTAGSHALEAPAGAVKPSSMPLKPRGKTDSGFYLSFSSVTLTSQKPTKVYYTVTSTTVDYVPVPMSKVGNSHSVHEIVSSPLAKVQGTKTFGPDARIWIPAEAVMKVDKDQVVSLHISLWELLNDGTTRKLMDSDQILTSKERPQGTEKQWIISNDTGKLVIINGNALP